MLYLHIPFCQSRCIYCDFFSTTQGPAARAAYVEALTAEMAERRNEVPDVPLPTVYVGGGTPSLLSPNEIAKLFAAIRRNFRLAPDAEITFETNPDDVTPALIEALTDAGVNRVSLGVQTLSDERLRLLRRRHTAAEARRAVETLYEAGITNLSIDLIYGLPGQTLSEWRRELKEALTLPVKHLSAYSLMVEEGTALHRLVKAGSLRPADDDTCREEYEVLIDTTRAAGLEHYEISNFARPGFASRHNSAYWDGTPYLGLGPGAHSFDGEVRRHVPADLRAYLEAHGHVAPIVEQLTADERFNELVFTALRTTRGLKLDTVAARFGPQAVEDLLSMAAPHLAANRLERLADGRLRLTREGIFVSDDVMSDLMRV